MQLRIHHGLVAIDQDSKRLIERGTRLAIGRHSFAVSVVRIHLACGSPVDGRETISCVVRAQLQDGESIELDEQAHDPYEAAMLAVRRLERILRRRGQI